MRKKNYRFNTTQFLSVAKAQEDTAYTVHFKNPWVDDSVYHDGAIAISRSQTLYVDGEKLLYHPGIPMKKEPFGDWYSVTFTAIPNPKGFQKGLFNFKIGMPPLYKTPLWFDSTGITTQSSHYTDFEAIEVFHLAQREPLKEIWIYPKSGAQRGLFCQVV